MNYGDTSLVPNGVDYAAVTPFIYLMMATLGMLGGDPAVQQYLDAEPQARQAIRELSRAVAAAGVRVRDSGKVRDEFDIRLGLFTAEEFWQFNLAVDVIALLATRNGIAPDSRALAFSDLRSLEEWAGMHHWKSGVRKAGTGPAQFGPLRAHVPPHKPHR